MRIKQLNKGFKMNYLRDLNMIIYLGATGLLLQYLIRLMIVSDFSGNFAPYFTNDTIQQNIIATQLIIVLPYIMLALLTSFVFMYCDLKHTKKEVN